MNWSLVIVLKLSLLNVLSHTHVLILHTLSINIVILETNKKKVGRGFWPGTAGAQSSTREGYGVDSSWKPGQNVVF